MSQRGVPDGMVADEVTVRRVQESDAEAITAIYTPFVVDSAVSFELSVPGPDEMTKRIETTSAHWCWLVAMIGSRCVGYAYGKPFRERAAYYQRSVDHPVEPDAAQAGFPA